MTCLEHLIENTLCDFENKLTSKEILENIKNDDNLQYAGITVEQCYEICQYVWCCFLDCGNRLREQKIEQVVDMFEKEVYKPYYTDFNYEYFCSKCSRYEECHQRDPECQHSKVKYC